MAGSSSESESCFIFGRPRFLTTSLELVLAGFFAFFGVSDSVIFCRLVGVLFSFVDVRLEDFGSVNLSGPSIGSLYDLIPDFNIERHSS